MLLMEESVLNDISKKLEELYYKVYMLEETVAEHAAHIEEKKDA